MKSAPAVQVDPDKAFAVQIAHEEAVVQEPVAYVQCGLLYTSSNGERRIRCALLAAFHSNTALHQGVRWISFARYRTAWPCVLAFNTEGPSVLHAPRFVAHRMLALQAI